MQTRRNNLAQAPAGSADFPVCGWTELSSSVGHDSIPEGRLESRPHQQAGKPALRSSGFSLIELLTAVSILMVIIYTLYSMFNQTQKALRANVTQVDVLESGRATAEMLGRELEQVAACNLPQTVNLYAGLMYIGNTVMVPPRLQMDTNEKNVLRTNVLEELFFLTRQTNRWEGVGYRVLRADNGVGTLFRYSVSTNYHWLNFTNLMSQFVHATLTTNPVTGQLSGNFNRIADGVIHFRLTAYDPDGRRLGADTLNTYPTYRLLRQFSNGSRMGLTSTANTTFDANVVLKQEVANQSQCYFVSNALPGYVEVELGVLEPNTLKQYEALKDTPNAAAAFLKRQAARVHLFRQRIPIRTVQQ